MATVTGVIPDGIGLPVTGSGLTESVIESVQTSALQAVLADRAIAGGPIGVSPIGTLGAFDAILSVRIPEATGSAPFAQYWG